MSLITALYAHVVESNGECIKRQVSYLFLIPYHVYFKGASSVKNALPPLSLRSTLRGKTMQDIQDIYYRTNENIKSKRYPTEKRLSRDCDIGLPLSFSRCLEVAIEQI